VLLNAWLLYTFVIKHASRCRLSLKAYMSKIFTGPLKNIAAFLFASVVLLKRNRLHLVCYTTVFLPVVFSVLLCFYELMCYITCILNIGK